MLKRRGVSRIVKGVHALDGGIQQVKPFQRQVTPGRKFGRAVEYVDGQMGTSSRVSSTVIMVTIAASSSAQRRRKTQPANNPTARLLAITASATTPVVIIKRSQRYCANWENGRTAVCLFGACKSVIAVPFPTALYGPAARIYSCTSTL